MILYNFNVPNKFKRVNLYSPKQSDLNLEQNVGTKSG